MKLGRLRLGTMIVLASIEGDTVTPLVIDSGEPWADPLRVWLERGQPASLEGAGVLDLAIADILAPVKAPQKIVAVGLNYADHAAEQAKPRPSVPMLFTKSPSAIVGPDTTVRWSFADSNEVDYEGELAVVIGTRCRHVLPAQALDYVLGYTICNDVTARDAQRNDGQYFRSKSFDTFCPLGPFVVTKNEIAYPQNLHITTKVNGEIRQDGTTADMIFGVAEVVSYVSRFMTLEPGDIVTTGTPAGAGSGRTPPVFLQNGDVVEIEIEKIGTLRNTIKVD